jgi:hypothetical protein
MHRLAALVVLGSLACSGRTGDSGSDTRFADGHSGLPATKRYVALSTSEKAQFCDWEASLLGGYGKAQLKTCTDGRCASISLPDQASCVADFSEYSASCEATVAEGENCAIDGCGTSCDPLFACTPNGVPGGPDAGAD